MRQWMTRIEYQTAGPGLYDITGRLAHFVAGCEVQQGQVTAFIQHTSASLTVQENADPDVLADLQDFFARIAPHSRTAYRHATEGPDDMPAHIKAALTQTSVSIPIDGGSALLGTWQGLYLFEHRDAPHNRTVIFSVIGG